MKVSAPEYYYRFRCIASDCPDSCCKEWEVDIDPEAAERYRALSGDLGDRLRQVLRKDGEGVCMTIENGKCPMWREDGLCRIQAELGHAALSKTCREFPRLRHDYGDFVELDLELSCPEAARLIFAGENQSLLEKNVQGGEVPGYDSEIMDILLRSREGILALLQSGEQPVNEALAILLLYAHSVQAEIDGGEAAVLDAADCLTDARRYAKSAKAQSVVDFFRELEILTDRWRDRLDAPAFGCTWDEKIRSLAVYVVRRYWLQAVSDFDLCCRAKFVVIACLLVKLLGGNVEQTAQLFSKEIENNPDNMEAILDGAYTAPAFTDVNLLGLLLAP